MYSSHPLMVEGSPCLPPLPFSVSGGADESVAVGGVTSPLEEARKAQRTACLELLEVSSEKRV